MDHIHKLYHSDSACADSVDSTHLEFVLLRESDTFTNTRGALGCSAIAITRAQLVDCGLCRSVRRICWIDNRLCPVSAGAFQAA